VTGVQTCALPISSYDHVGNYDLAKKSINAALKLADEIEDPFISAWAFRRSYIANNYTDHMNELSNAISIFEKNGEKVDLARLLNNLGVEYLRRGDLDDANKYLTKSLHLFEESNSCEQDFPANNLGVLCLMQNKLDKAEDLLTLSLSRSSEEFNRISIFTNLSYLAILNRNEEKAKHYIKCIIAGLRGFHDPRLKEKCLITISIIYLKIGKNKTAHAILREAMKIDTRDKKDDCLHVLKETISNVLSGINHKDTGKNVSLKIDDSRLPPLFSATGYYPCLIAFYY